MEIYWPDIFLTSFGPVDQSEFRTLPGLLLFNIDSNSKYIYYPTVAIGINQHGLKKCKMHTMNNYISGAPHLPYHQ